MTRRWGGHKMPSTALDGEQPQGDSAVLNGGHHAAILWLNKPFPSGTATLFKELTISNSWISSQLKFWWIKMIALNYSVSSDLWRNYCVFNDCASLADWPFLSIGNICHLHCDADSPILFPNCAIFLLFFLVSDMNKSKNLATASWHFKNQWQFFILVGIHKVNSITGFPSSIFQHSWRRHGIDQGMRRLPLSTR